jgi:hypothetical protein
MNVHSLRNESLNAIFEAGKRGGSMIELKGHRSVGGMRANDIHTPCYRWLSRRWSGSCGVQTRHRLIATDISRSITSRRSA